MNTIASFVYLDLRDCKFVTTGTVELISSGDFPQNLSAATTLFVLKVLDIVQRNRGL